MSIQYGVTCLDCRAVSPGVGDGGFLGMPSLRTEAGAYKFLPDSPTFGYLYEPLRLLGLRSYEFEAFDSFLRQHVDHLLYLHSDHDDPDQYPAEIARRRADLDADDDDVHETFQEQRRLEEESVASGAFVDAYYALDCARCGAKYAATDVCRFRAFTTLPVAREAVQLFIERWGTLSPDEGWNHRLMPPLDPWAPFLERLTEFLKRHQDHDLTARLSSTPLADGLPVERMKEVLDREPERKEQPGHGGGYGGYLARLLGAWVVVDVVPLVYYVATRPSVTGPAQVAAFAAVFIVASLVWTLLGARFAWGKVGHSHSRTMGRGVAFAVRALALSWAAWTLFNMIGPRLPPVWAVMAVAIEWLHIWMLPSTIALGALAGHLQWRAFPRP